MDEARAARLLNGLRRAADGLVLGCDYNPEQWPREVWDEDVRLMREAGVSLVAVNIFGWSRLEPRDGQFDFAALDEVIDLLHDNGIRVNLGSGTSSPPAWLCLAHPDIMPTAKDGTRRWFGGRQAWCPSSPIYRRYALRLTEQVATRYATHPAIALWHVSNELGCHNALCYCETSAAAFRAWLRDRYGEINALNRAWGTDFWSQVYHSWDEVSPPRLTLSGGNPSQELDFARFSSDQVLDCYRAEADLIRRHSAVPVTTNLMVTDHIRTMDYWTWVDDLDVIANDHYLDHRLPDPRLELDFAADVSRGLAAGSSWMLMEHSTSAVSWQERNLAKQPGELTRDSLAHVARGADAVCFFQWRASRQGTEKYHSAMLPHAGTDSAVWREVVQLGGVLRRLRDVGGSRVVTPVAVMVSFEARWACEGEAIPSRDVEYLDQVRRVYRALRDQVGAVQIVAPGSDLSGFAFVAVPALYLLRERHAAELDEWVRAGGHALVTFLSGIVDADDRVYLGGYPGALRDLVGIRSEEFVPLPPGQQVTLDDGSAARLWTERTRATTAETVASYRDGPTAGCVAVSRNRRGAGRAHYLGTQLDDADLDAHVRRMLAEAGVGDGQPSWPRGTRIVTRASESTRYDFLFNDSEEDWTVPISGAELVTGQVLDGAVAVPAGSVRVVHSEVQPALPTRSTSGSADADPSRPSKGVNR